MQITYPYRALTALRAPGTMVNGYQPGDGVPESVVESWELTVGSDVMPVDTTVVPRPADDEPERGPWQAYAIGQGIDVGDAHAMSLDDLRAVEQVKQAEPESVPEPSDRPAPTAIKDEWIAWAIANGADKTWANDRATTKAALQDFSPNIAGPTADPVAESASDTQADANENG